MRPLGPAVFFEAVRGLVAGLALAALGWLVCGPILPWRQVAAATIAVVAISTTISVTDEIAARIRGDAFVVRFVAGFALPFTPIVGLLSFGSNWSGLAEPGALLGPLSLLGFVLGTGRAIAGLEALTHYRLVAQAGIPGLLTMLFAAIVPPTRHATAVDTAVTALIAGAGVSFLVLALLGLLALGHFLSAPLERRIAVWLALDGAEEPA